MRYENVINHKEFATCVTKINKWYLRKSKMLTIISTPYNSSIIYSSIINELLRNGGKVLYIWGKNKSNINLINNIKLTNKNVTYSYLEKGVEDVQIIFTSFKNAINIRGYYDLCIIDDISSFSYVGKEELLELIEAMYLYSKRIILYSIEKVVTLGERIEVSELQSNRPFVEPRIISTRIKLDEDIPYSLYDYLKWFRDNKKTVLILAPTEEKSKSIYSYYSEKLNISGTKVVRLNRDSCTKDIDGLLKIKDKSLFIVSNYVENYIEYITDMSIVILFADDISYSYKKMIFMCAEVGKGNKVSGEVLMVSKDISENMDKVKGMARDFNKKVWEKGLLK
ncbi:hypothetical protein [Clostridium sp.]|uniref:hypothetical protein n=1 Tax=Clostridium sp. TaxID=1506 RepID=UPI003F37D8D5